MDYSLLGSSLYGISQARILEWVALSFSKGSSLPRDQTHVSCISRQILYGWATREALLCISLVYNLLSIQAVKWTENMNQDNAIISQFKQTSSLAALLTNLTASWKYDTETLMIVFSVKIKTRWWVPCASLLHGVRAPSIAGFLMPSPSLPERIEVTDHRFYFSFRDTLWTLHKDRWISS